MGLTRPAEAAPRLSLFGVADTATFSNQISVNSGSSGIGGGIGVEFPVSSSSGLELGLNWIQRRNDFTSRWIQLPLLYRFWIGRYVSVGAGGYYARGVGSITQSNGTSADFQTVGLGKGDAGLTGLIGGNIPFSKYSLLIEGRYNVGAYDVSTVQGVTATYSDIQLLFGVRFGGASKP